MRLVTATAPAPTVGGMPTAIITGASRGLGLALARALAQRGWALVLDARGTAELERVARELGADHRSSRGPRRRRRRLAPRRARRSGGRPDRPARQQRQRARARARSRRWRTTRSTSSSASTASTCSRRSRWPSWSLPRLPDGGCIINVTSDAAVEPYEGWGGYGSSKAALEQVSAILAAEQPALRVYAVDPGDMRTRMHQEAFPGEDISDRPPPEESVPGLLALIEGGLPSGRYRARELPAHAGEAVRRLSAYAFDAARGARGARAARGARPGAATRSGCWWPGAADGLDRARALRRARPACSKPGDLLVVNVSATIPARGRRPAPDGEPVARALRDAGAAARRRLVGGRAADLRTAARPLRATRRRALDARRRRRARARRAVRVRARGCCSRGSAAAESVIDYLERHGSRSATATCPRRWPLGAYQNVYATTPGSAEMASAGTAVQPPS